MIRGFGLDIGGSWARLYKFKESKVESVQRARLLGSGPERVEVIAGLVASAEGLPPSLPTACAGKKDELRTEVVQSHFGTELRQLSPRVHTLTGVSMAPLFDDDVCAGWGHLYSPLGSINATSPNTLLLTGGTGVAENLWIEGAFLEKGSYPSCSELGLEAGLRAEAWREPDSAAGALAELLDARRAWSLERIVLSGRLAELPEVRPLQLSQRLGCEVELVSLPEAPALGAVVLAHL